jgi:hypothetical protein
MVLSSIIHYTALALRSSRISKNVDGKQTNKQKVPLMKNG